MKTQYVLDNHDRLAMLEELAQIRACLSPVGRFNDKEGLPCIVVREGCLVEANERLAKLQATFGELRA